MAETADCGRRVLNKRTATPKDAAENLERRRQGAVAQFVRPGPPRLVAQRQPAARRALALCRHGCIVSQITHCKDIDARHAGLFDILTNRAQLSQPV